MKLISFKKIGSGSFSRVFLFLWNLFVFCYGTFQQSKKKENVCKRSLFPESNKKIEPSRQAQFITDSGIFCNSCIFGEQGFQCRRELTFPAIWSNLILGLLLLDFALLRVVYGLFGQHSPLFFVELLPKTVYNFSRG